MRIFFSAGEPSGDQHGARLIKQLQAASPEIKVEGFGGPEMRDSGCQLLFELTELAVMGFLRVVPLIRKFHGLVQLAERHMDRQRPDAVVLIDFPGFNWWIARAAKRRGIPVFYYLPPQLWAWAPWRIRKVRRWVDHVLCALPFEYDWYKARGVASTWVGHPFFDQVQERPLQAEVLRQLRPDSSAPVVAVLPGSRNHEIEKNWTVMLEVIRRVSREVPDVRWVVGSYRDQQQQRCETLQREHAPELKLNYLVNATSEVIAAADCCLMVSGSISLELLARRTPGIVLYRVPTVGRFFARFLMLCRYITLPNLMADAELFPEFVSNGNPETDIQNMTNQLVTWLKQPEQLNQTRQSVAELADKTAAPGASRRTADWILQHLHRDDQAAETGAKAA
jgi:lipid-A-disaccharide synthase